MLNVSTEVLTDVVLEVGKIGLWLQTIGALVIVWLIFQIVNYILGKNKKKVLEDISKRLDKMDRKLNKLIKEDKSKKAKK